MFVRPVDLPTLRDEAVDNAVQTGAAYQAARIRAGAMLMKPPGAPEAAGRRLAETEVQRLERAELYYVAEAMVDLAVAASASLPEFGLQPEDVPARTGLVFFEKPIAFPVRSEFRGGVVTPVVGAAWDGPPPWAPPGRTGVWITWYTDRDAVLADMEGKATDEQIRSLRRLSGRLQSDDDMWVPFSKSIPVTRDGDPIRVNEATGLVRWSLTLKAAWLLMQQPVSVVSDAVYDRAARRRLQKQGQEPPRVRVITLRRPASIGTGESDREWHHQWIVRGHWRQQWYPARQVHRPVWIAPHVKGPEGKPMLGGEKVYAWKR